MNFLISILLAVVIGMPTLLAPVTTTSTIPSAQVASVAASSYKWGHAFYYSRGVMEHVVTVRTRQGYYPSDAVAGYASVSDCSKLGHFLWASLNGHRWERYQIMDCSAPRDRARHIATWLVLEVDYESAVRNGFVRDGRARAAVWMP